MGANSLKNKHPEIAKEWNYALNEGITPDVVAPHSNKKFWWICEKGHSFKASPVNKFNSPANSCPYCTNHKVLSGFNDMIIRYPYLENDWDYEKNKGVNPKMIMPGSAKKYWWKCGTCGNSWNSMILVRISQNAGCPYCSGKRKLNKPIQN